MVGELLSGLGILLRTLTDRRQEKARRSERLDLQSVDDWSLRNRTHPQRADGYDAASPQRRTRS